MRSGSIRRKTLAIEQTTRLLRSVLHNPQQDQSTWNIATREFVALSELAARRRQNIIETGSDAWDVMVSEFCEGLRKSGIKEEEACVRTDAYFKTVRSLVQGDVIEIVVHMLLLSGDYTLCYVVDLILWFKPGGSYKVTAPQACPHWKEAGDVIVRHSREALGYPSHKFDIEMHIADCPGGIDDPIISNGVFGDSWQLSMAIGIAYYLDRVSKKLLSDGKPHVLPYICTGALVNTRTSTAVNATPPEVPKQAFLRLLRRQIQTVDRLDLKIRASMLRPDLPIILVPSDKSSKKAVAEELGKGSQSSKINRKRGFWEVATDLGGKQAIQQYIPVNNLARAFLAVGVIPKVSGWLLLAIPLLCSLAIWWCRDSFLDEWFIWVGFALGATTVASWFKLLWQSRWFHGAGTAWNRPRFHAKNIAPTLLTAILVGLVWWNGVRLHPLRSGSLEKLQGQVSSDFSTSLLSMRSERQVTHLRPYLQATMLWGSRFPYILWSRNSLPLSYEEQGRLINIACLAYAQGTSGVPQQSSLRDLAISIRSMFRGLKSQSNWEAIDKTGEETENGLIVAFNATTEGDPQTHRTVGKTLELVGSEISEAKRADGKYREAAENDIKYRNALGDPSGR